MSSEQFAELGYVNFLAFSARVCSFAFLTLVVLSIAICRAVFVDLVLFSGFSLGLSLLSVFVDFSYYKGSFFLIPLGAYSWVFLYRAFLLYDCVLF